MVGQNSGVGHNEGSIVTQKCFDIEIKTGCIGPLYHDVEPGRNADALIVMVLAQS